MHERFFSNLHNANHDELHIVTNTKGYQQYTAKSQDSGTERTQTHGSAIRHSYRQRPVVHTGLTLTMEIASHMFTFCYKNSLKFAAMFPEAVFMDCTQMNRFKMPLFNIIDTTPCNKTFEIGSCFVAHEKRARL